MGRRDHLLRIALCAKQAQLVDAPDDDEEEDIQADPTSDMTVKLDPSTQKKIKYQGKLDAAQEAILSAIGFMTEPDVKKTEEEREKDGASISTFVGLITYHLPLPMYSQRNQALVPSQSPFFCFRFPFWC